MIGHLTLIFLCQLIGEIVVRSVGWSIPGPVLGMIILFAIFCVRGGLPDDLGQIAGTLHRYMALLFVPAGAGVILHFRLLGQSLVPIAVALVVSTVLTIAVTAWLMQALGRGGGGDD